MPLCLATGAVSVTLAIQAFTLAWTHSIEKIRWEEDWRIEGKQLHIVAARIRGSGAGMEPPPDAVLRDGLWHYRPTIAPMNQLMLANSAYTADYELCMEGNCRRLAEHLPGTEATTADSTPVTATPCEAGS
jgi:hypothetical protein